MVEGAASFPVVEFDAGFSDEEKSVFSREINAVLSLYHKDFVELIDKIIVYPENIFEKDDAGNFVPAKCSFGVIRLAINPSRIRVYLHHELGHAVFDKLSKEFFDEWLAIARDTSEEPYCCYAKKSVIEDFACCFEAFTAYDNANRWEEIFKSKVKRLAFFKKLFESRGKALAPVKERSDCNRSLELKSKNEDVVYNGYLPQYKAQHQAMQESFDHHDTAIKYSKKMNYNKAIEEITLSIECGVKAKDYADNHYLAGCYWYRGLVYHSKHDYDKAVKDFEKAIELNPSNAQYYYWRGFVFERMNCFDKALKDYDKALELKSTHEKARKKKLELEGRLDTLQKLFDELKKRGSSLRRGPYSPTMFDEASAYAFHEMSFSFYSRNWLEEALQAANAAVLLDGNDSGYYFHRGSVYLKLFDFEKAIVDLNKAIELYGGDSPEGYYCYRGEAFLCNNDFESAVKDFTHLIAERGRGGAYFYALRANAYYKLGKLELARKDIDKALEQIRKDSLSTTDFDAFRLGVLVNIGLEDGKKALEIANGLVDCNHSRDVLSFLFSSKSMNVLPYLLRSKARLAVGNVVGGLNDLRVVVQALPRESFPCFILACFLHEFKQFGESVKWFEKAVELDELIPLYFFRLGLLYEELGEAGKAKNCFARMLKLFPASDASKVVKRLFARGQGRKAVEKLKELIEKNPGDHEACLLFACVGGESERFEEAMALLESLVKRFPSYGAAWFQLGQLYLADIERDDREESIGCFTRALMSDYESFGVYFKCGLARLHRIGSERAVEDFTKALEFKPGDAKALCLRGERHLQNDEYDEAMRDFERIPENKNFNLLVSSRRAWNCLLSENLDEAAKLFTKMIECGKPEEFDRKDLNPFLGRGKCFYRLKQYEKAVQDFSKCIELFPDHFQALYLRGCCYHDLKDYDKAIPDFVASLKFSKSSSDFTALLFASDAFNSLTDAFLEKLDFDSLIDYSSKAISEGAFKEEAFVKRGLGFFAKGDFEQAEKDLNKAIELKSSANSFKVRGAMYMAKGDSEKAIQDFTKSVELNPTPAAYYYRGCVHERLNEFDKAAEDYDKASKLGHEKAGERKKEVEKRTSNAYIGEATVSFKDVGGMSKVKKLLRELVILPMKNKKLAKKYGRKVGGEVLLYGPPGCGKTYIATAIAGEAACSFVSCKLSDVLSKWIGDTEKNVHALFETAKKNAPSVLFLDEIECLTGVKSQTARWEKTYVNQLLQEIDELGKTEANVLLIASTNAPWEMDAAFKRQGRFGTHVYIGAPDAETREEAFKIHCKNLPVAKEADFEKLAGLTEGFSCANIASICKNAAAIPWRQALITNNERLITMQDFQQALEQEKSDLHEWFTQQQNNYAITKEPNQYKELIEDMKKFNKLKEDINNSMYG